ncbi:MAG: hypothetical protein FWH40_10305 [Coriobacteriia bacterium]|nr:hypothetical protein [Coriobacteriia bacterium]
MGNDVSDFTNRVREQLLRIIGLADHGLGELYAKESRDWIYDNGISVDTSGFQDVIYYYAELEDLGNYSRAMLERLFDAAYNLDSNLAQNVRAQRDIAQQLGSSLRGLADAIGPPPAGRVSHLLQPPGRYREYLFGNISSLYDAIANSLARYDEDGMLVYDWEAFRRILDRDATDISECEYYVIAYLYLGMDDEAITELFRVMADKIGDVDHTSLLEQVFINEDYSEYTEWYYDADKVDGILKYVVMFAKTYEVSLYQLDLLSDEEISSLYFQLFPEGTESTVVNQRKALRIQLDVQHCDLIQLGDLLATLKGLESRPAATEVASEAGYNTFEGGSLTGRAGAPGPDIYVVRTNDDFEIHFSNTVTMSTSSGLGFPSTTYMHFNENVVIIKKTTGANEAVDIVLEYMKDYYTAEYSSDLLSFLSSTSSLESYGDFVTDQAMSWTLGKLLEQGSSKAAKVAIPIIGDVLCLGIDLVKEHSENVKALSDSQSLIDSAEKANYCDDLEMKVTLVVDGSASIEVRYTPTIETYYVINNINWVIEHYSIDLSKYELEYPVTIEDILYQPDNVIELLNQGMSSSQRTFATDPNNGRQTE